ncbi:hypothetical protein AGMMS49543_27540 [Betaproteobacteria bacterium]|nr:hypothetical protein AGMMS49543_27540 [Betaproteobacteria bacterium]
MANTSLSLTSSNFIDGIDFNNSEVLGDGPRKTIPKYLLKYLMSERYDMFISKPLFQSHRSESDYDDFMARLQGFLVAESANSSTQIFYANHTPRHYPYVHCDVNPEISVEFTKEWLTNIFCKAFHNYLKGWLYI